MKRPVSRSIIQIIAAQFQRGLLPSKNFGRKIPEFWRLIGGARSCACDGKGARNGSYDSPKKNA
jgi:hypothetical protein